MLTANDIEVVCKRLPCIKDDSDLQDIVPDRKVRREVLALDTIRFFWGENDCQIDYFHENMVKRLNVTLFEGFNKGKLQKSWG